MSLDCGMTTDHETIVGFRLKMNMNRDFAFWMDSSVTVEEAHPCLCADLQRAILTRLMCPVRRFELTAIL